MTFTALNLYNFQLPVFLGVPDEERSALQSVYVDIQLQFSKPPLACETDRIGDTICYATLVEVLEKNIGEKNFHLIEYLGTRVYQEIRSIVSQDTVIAIKLRKNPPLTKLEVSEFCMGIWK
jgi:dihydroneopterin aldolase